MGSIICGVDGTKSGARAVNVARELGAQLGLQLVFVRVVPLGAAAEETTAIAEQLEELGADDNWLVEVGRPVDRLVAAAADDQVRLLVVGSHGPRSSLLGSVSAELSRRASCPVVVVPPERECGRCRQIATRAPPAASCAWGSARTVASTPPEAFCALT